jgi:hypothetical protein
MYPVISPLRRLMLVPVMLCFRQFAFPRNALMLFVCTFDAIFELAPIVRELFGHFVDAAWHIATDCGPEGHAHRRGIYVRASGTPCSQMLDADLLLTRCNLRRNRCLRG